MRRGWSDGNGRRAAQACPTHQGCCPNRWQWRCAGGSRSQVSKGLSAMTPVDDRQLRCWPRRRGRTAEGASAPGVGCVDPAGEDLGPDVFRVELDQIPLVCHAPACHLRLRANCSASELKLSSLRASSAARQLLRKRSRRRSLWRTAPDIPGPPLGARTAEGSVDRASMRGSARDSPHSQRTALNEGDSTS